MKIWVVSPTPQTEKNYSWDELKIILAECIPLELGADVENTRLICRI